MGIQNICCAKCGNLGNDLFCPALLQVILMQNPTLTGLALFCTNADQNGYMVNILVGYMVNILVGYVVNILVKIPEQSGQYS
jgi:uncharacterized membrane protein